MKFTDFTYSSKAYFKFNGIALPFSVADVFSEKLASQKCNLSSFSAFIAKGIFVDKDLTMPDDKGFETQTGLKVSVASLANMMVRFDLGYLHFSHEDTGTEKGTGLRSELVSNGLNADVYVFCDFIQSQPKLKEPIELAHWDFYVAEASMLNDFVHRNESINSASIQDLVAIKSDFKQVRSAVHSVAHSLQFPFY